MVHDVPEGITNGDDMRRLTRVTALAVTLAVAVPLALAACGRDREAPEFVATSPAATPSTGASASPAQPFSLAVTPPANAKNLPISAEIGTKITGGQITAVTLRDNEGDSVTGAMRDDGTSWVPSRPLKYGRTYTATVTASRAEGGAETRTTTFSTMKSRRGQEIGTGLYLFDGRTYGVAMPVVAEFHPGIAPKERASVQRRLFVTSDPPQPGVWHWVSGGTQAYYRPPDYWQPGTKLTVRLGLDGHPVGGGRYGGQDRRATVTIGRKLTMEVDNRTKKMSVYENGTLVKQMPVSLGKKSTPSSSGTMVIMEKKETTVFDTFAELGPREGYRTNINYAQRLTWGGEYIHSAPWSVGDQGRRNVSHGCVNMSPRNAVWLFKRTLIGDPVTVRGTERGLEDGNGWTAWTYSWSEFIKGSALPVPAELVEAGRAKPSATPGATATPGPTATPGT